MARAILIAGALAWSLAFALALGVAILGVEALLRLLPPLTIDADAVRGAAVALSVALGLGGVTHLAVLIGMRGGRRWAWSGGTLLCALLAAVFLALGAAAFASAAASSASTVPLLLAGAAAVAVAAAYGVATALLVAEMRSGSAS